MPADAVLASALDDALVVIILEAAALMLGRSCAAPCLPLFSELNIADEHAQPYKVSVLHCLR